LRILEGVESFLDLIPFSNPRKHSSPVRSYAVDGEDPFIVSEESGFHRGGREEEEDKDTPGDSDEAVDDEDPLRFSSTAR
jgi:hypothetical protein